MFKHDHVTSFAINRILPLLACFCAALLVAPASAAEAPAKTAKKETVIILSWGDLIGNPKYPGAAQMDTPENVQATVHIWKTQGVDKVLFRVDDFRYFLFHDVYENPTGAYRDWIANTKKGAASNVLAAAVAAAKKEGIEIQMWISIFDEGAPPSVFYSDDVSFPWQSKFLKANPHFQVNDRSVSESGRKYQWGVPECAYPEVRAYFLEEIRAFADKYDFDGVFLSVRSHAQPPEHADQFGFNEPIVTEYKKRYGVDILRQDFDLEKWRALRGEYFTTFLREVHAHLQKRGQKLAIGVAQGEHIGPPFGNMQIQWRTWVSEKIVDELVIGHHTLERATYPNRYQRTWGYLQNQDNGNGLPPLLQALREGYGPLCRQYGVKLYADVPLGNFTRKYVDPTVGKGTEAPADDVKFVEDLRQIPDLSGVIVDGRTLSVPHPYGQ